MLHGVNLGRLDVAKLPVYRPHMHAFRYLLVFRGGVVVVDVEILVTLRHIAHLIYLLFLPTQSNIVKHLINIVCFI